MDQVVPGKSMMATLPNNITLPPGMGDITLPPNISSQEVSEMFKVCPSIHHNYARFCLRQWRMTADTPF
jgi:hypothetical protein